MNLASKRAPVVIESADDPRIEPFRDVRERDMVGRGGLIAEGTVVLDQLLRSERFRPTALLVLRNRLAGLAGRLETLPDDVPLYVAERDVFDSIAGFPVHRGVLAHAVRRADAPAVDFASLAAEKALLLVAVGISNHDNVGALFRNAAAFGVGAILLDETACDPLYRKAIRVSVGTALTVPFRREGSAPSLVRALQAAGFACRALSPKAEDTLRNWRPSGPTALIVGTEGEGLPEEIRRAVAGLRIEMAGSLDSLNVANSAAIALHHACVWRGPKG